MSYASCRRCGAQLAEPKLGSKMECPSCHAVYSVKTPMQASDGAPHCHCCGADVDDDALAGQQVKFLTPDGKVAPLGVWVCSGCRRGTR